ncbi:matrixin family metalloprotease [Spirillospora sp. CA-128828]|uniref:matrixin family metalloprotease n=1 Tax=Spirillospora sp. CA-128828 TaxID=3240033 RepID=UPI003D8BB52D
MGWENFTNDDLTVMNDATWSARRIYWQVGFDLFGFFTYSIPLAQAQGYAYVDQDSEAEWLTSQWSIPNDGIDVFLVKGYAGPTAGLSPVTGPCDKNLAWPSMTGAVVEMAGPATNVGLAHEIGHYLGLAHDNDPNNLMYPSVDSGGPVADPRLTFGQGAQIAQHCFTRLP